MPDNKISALELLRNVELASIKLDKANESFRDAHSTLSDDRHTWAGKVYRAQQQLNEAVRRFCFGGDDE